MIPVPDTAPCPRRALFTGKAFAQRARPACEEASRWPTAHSWHCHAPRPRSCWKTTPRGFRDTAGARPSSATALKQRALMILQRTFAVPWCRAGWRIGDPPPLQSCWSHTTGSAAPAVLLTPVTRTTRAQPGLQLEPTNHIPWQEEKQRRADTSTQPKRVRVRCLVPGSHRLGHAEHHASATRRLRDGQTDSRASAGTFAHRGTRPKSICEAAQGGKLPCNRERKWNRKCLSLS